MVEAAPIELPDVLPARHPEVDVAEFDGVLVTFDARSNQVHMFADVVALVFDACDGITPTATLIGELTRAGFGSEEEVCALVDELLLRLADMGLLEGTEPRRPPPCIGWGGAAAMSKRQRRLVRR